MAQNTGIQAPEFKGQSTTTNKTDNTDRQEVASAMGGDRVSSAAISPPSERADSPSDLQVLFFHDNPNREIAAPYACRYVEQLCGGSPRLPVPSPAVKQPDDQGGTDPYQPFFKSSIFKRIGAGSPRPDHSSLSDETTEFESGITDPNHLGRNPYHLDSDAFEMDFDVCSDQKHPSPQVKSVDDQGGTDPYPLDSDAFEMDFDESDDSVVSEAVALPGAVALPPDDDRDARAAETDDSLSNSVPFNRSLWGSVQLRVSDETDQVETYVANTMLTRLGLPDGNFIGDKNMKEHFMRKLDIPGVPDATIIVDANGNPITLPPGEDDPQIQFAQYLEEESNYGRKVHIKCSQVCEVNPGTAKSMILEKLEKSSAFLTWLKHYHPQVKCDSFEISIVHDVKASGANLSHSGFISTLVIYANSNLDRLKSPDAYERLSHEDKRLTPQILALKKQFDQYTQTVPTIYEELQNLSEQFEIKAYELELKGRNRYFEDHTVGSNSSSPEIGVDMMRCMAKSVANGNFRPAQQDWDMEDGTSMFDFDAFYANETSQETGGVDEGNDVDGGTRPDPETPESGISMSEEVGAAKD